MHQLSVHALSDLMHSLASQNSCMVYISSLGSSSYISIMVSSAHKFASKAGDTNALPIIEHCSEANVKIWCMGEFAMATIE